MEIITLDSIIKRFGNFIAVNNISLNLNPLTINGFLGPNGAGKTTTIKMMCGLLKPTSGKIILNGVDVVKNPEKAREKIGYMSQNFSLYPDLTPAENIQFFADLYKLKQRDERLKKIIEELNLYDYLDLLTRDLPIGIKQRVALAAATIHKPLLLFLDEPTSGVDPLSRIEFFKYIKKYINENRATAVISTHFLTEAAYCDSIYLFHRGKIIIKGTPSDLINNFGYYVFETDISKENMKILDILRSIPDVIDTYVFGKKLRIITKKNIETRTLSINTAIKIQNIYPSLPTFEDLFISLTND